MTVIINIGVFFLNVLYAFHKLCPTRNQVCVISRQSKEPSLDVKMLQKEFQRQHPDIEFKTLYRMIPPGLMGKARYMLHMIGPEMHALATSRVVILEGYCISASVLNHKENLKILQMWHALGICKRFGYYVEGEAEGYSTSLIQALRMHQNYDAVLTSSEFCRPFYAKAFHYPEEVVKVIPLPRVDLLRSEDYMRSKGEEIRSTYPELNNGKKNILFAPTLRKGRDGTTAVEKLVAAVDREKYNLIVKLHPVEGRNLDWDGMFSCPEYSSLELLSVADAVITDYSAFLFEAAVSGKPLYFYTWDIEDYLTRRGFCIDFVKEMPGTLHRSAQEVMKAVEAEDWSPEKQKAFSRRFVEGTEHNTFDLAGFVAILYNESISV